MCDIKKKLYEVRFNKEEVKKKEKLWKILIENFLQKYVSSKDAVLDVGGGYCEFINIIKCQKKYVVDINPDVKKYANNNVIILNQSAQDISELAEESINVVFASNFFEHISSKEQVLIIISEINRILKLGGKLIVIQPNIKYVYKEYWDFFDHHIPFTEKSFSEALRTSKFEIIESYSRFLPYSTKIKMSRFSLLLRIYLRYSILWKVFGRQFFLVAKKTK